MALRRLLVSRNGGRAAAAILQAGVQVAELSPEELWLDYFALGGDATLSEVNAMVAGETPLSRLDHDRLAVVINERLQQVGFGRPLAYWDGSR
jgi:hypothetical protein